MTPERLTEIRAWTQRDFLPGTNLGQATAMLRELLTEREHMREVVGTAAHRLYKIGDAQSVEIADELDAAYGAA